MPHVVFNKKVDLVEFSKQFTPIIKKEDFLIKLLDVFVNKESYSALIPTIVIDKNHQNFFIEISTREAKTTVRLYPGTDPEKTNGVKTAMGLVAKMIADHNPDAKLTRTNIIDFIPTIKN